MDRRTKRTKAAIWDAYFSLLMDEKASSHITIAEITRKANIDRKTFYLHYNSTEDILKEFSDDRVDELMDRLREDGFFEHPFDIGLFFRDFNNLVMKDIDLYKKLIKTSNFEFICRGIQDLLVDTIREVYDGIVNVSSEELDVYARFYSSGVISTYIAWLQEEIPVGISKLEEFVGDVTHFGAGKLVPTVE